MFSWFFSECSKVATHVFTLEVCLCYIYHSHVHIFSWLSLTTGLSSKSGVVLSCMEKEVLIFLISSAWKIWYFHQFNALSPTFYCVGACTKVLSEALYFLSERLSFLRSRYGQQRRAVLTEEFADKGYALMCFSHKHKEHKAALCNPVYEMAASRRYGGIFLALVSKWDPLKRVEITEPQN